MTTIIIQFYYARLSSKYKTVNVIYEISELNKLIHLCVSDHVLSKVARWLLINRPIIRKSIHHPKNPANVLSFCQNTDE